MSYIKGRKISGLKWYANTTFVVSSDFKSHTEEKLTTGKGAIIYVSRKQKMNTKSSTEADLLGADDS